MRRPAEDFELAVIERVAPDQVAHEGHEFRLAPAVANLRVDFEGHSLDFTLVSRVELAVWALCETQRLKVATNTKRAGGNAYTESAGYGQKESDDGRRVEPPGGGVVYQRIRSADGSTVTHCGLQPRLPRRSAGGCRRIGRDGACFHPSRLFAAAEPGAQPLHPGGIRAFE